MVEYGAYLTDKFGKMCRVAGAVIALVTCLGPVLLIVGCVLIVMPNTYQTKVDAYTAAVARWTAGDSDRMMATVGTVETLGGYSPISLAPVRTAVKIVGVEPADVPDAWSVSAKSTAQTAYGSGTYRFNTSINATGTVSSMTVNIGETTKQTSKLILCECVTTGCTCYASALSSKCKADGGIWTQTSSSCSMGTRCGTCELIEMLTEVCQPVTYVPPPVGAEANVTGTWAQSSTLQSCTYPFQGKQEFSATISSTTTSTYARIISDQDPMIALANITEGLNTFGLSAAQQRKAGAALLAVGVLLTVGVFAGLCKIIKALRGDPKYNKELGKTDEHSQPMVAHVQEGAKPAPPTPAPVAPVVAPYPPAPAPEQHQQPQQQVAYAPPPQQHVAPPAPAPYGAPPPAPYGAPAPMPYGAPAPYGAPPPAPYGAPPAPAPYGAPPAPAPYGAPPQAPAPYGAPPAPAPYGAPGPAPYGAPPMAPAPYGAPPDASYAPHGVHPM